jgi:hypothetical protein
MTGFIEWLKGKKSYILLVVAFVFNLGLLQGWWTADSSTWQAIDTLILALLGVSFRAAIQKSGE